MKTDFVLFNLREILDTFPEGINVSFAGGCVRDMLVGDKIKDYDLFCSDKVSEDAIIEYLNNNDHNSKFLNENDILANFMYKDKFIQVIKGRYYGIDPKNIIDMFDYTICCASVTKTSFNYNKYFFEDCLTKSLRINKITYPLSTLERLQKYIKKGYTACSGTILEIAKSISLLDLSNEEDINNTLRFYPDGTSRFIGID